MNAMSLFTGIGGADIAATEAGIEILAMSEIDHDCSCILKKNFPGIPNLGDIKTITKESFYAATGHSTADIVFGGFPCQPFSVAGNQRGKDDDRHLWPEMLRIIKELKPSWIVGENVAGFIKLALDETISDLEAEGYETRAFVLPACAVGANHRRDRVFIIAYSDLFRCDSWCGDRKKRRIQGYEKRYSSKDQSKRQGWIAWPCQSSQAASNTCSYRSQTHEGQSRYQQGEIPKTRKRYTWRSCGIGGERWVPEPAVPGMLDGIPSGLDKSRVKQLGNAIVPHQIYPIFEAIVAIDRAFELGKKEGA